MLILMILFTVAMVPMVGHYHGVAVRKSFAASYVRLECKEAREMFAASRWDGFRGEEVPLGEQYGV